MTIIFEDPTVAGPATHVLVIGIGRYPHLPGGGDPVITAYDDGMRQLTSPPVSAKHFCDWAISSFDNPNAPLSSVELLLSDDTQSYTRPSRQIGGQNFATETFPVDIATLNAMIAAAASWKARGNSHPNNLLLFYFCGHGMSSGSEMALVASDYGSGHPKPLSGLVNFSQFVVGMSDCVATQQCYFIDACRMSSEQLVASRNFKGDELVIALEEETTGLKQCEFFSTLHGQKAHGLTGRPSVYTTALLLALKGTAARDKGLGWRVTTSLLLDALDHFMEEVVDHMINKVQVPTMKQANLELHRIVGEPELPLLVPLSGHVGDAPPASLENVEVLANAVKLAAHPEPVPALPHALTWKSRHFETWLKPGQYEVAVTHIGDAAPRTKSFDLQPPGYSVLGL